MGSIAVQMALARLMEAGLVFQGELKGCTEQEIQLIENHFGIELPNSYRDFLGVMGRCAGGFLVGSSYAFPDVLEFRGGAENLLRRCQVGFQLPPNAFVFFHHQGYTFEWFNCRKRVDDPPVLMFTDSEREPRIVSGSFSAWLITAAEDDIAAYRELNG